PDTEYYSDEIDITPRIHYIDDESRFEINQDGVITKYKGTIQCLYVPETINGIPVTGFESGAFNNNRIIELTLPKTIKEIPENAFSKNTALVVQKPSVQTGGFFIYTRHQQQNGHF
ncbi:hypothetical protein OBE_01691, partial [human gut metagenome]